MNQNTNQYNLLPAKDNINLMVDTCWQIAISALWPTVVTTLKDEVKARQLLCNRILQAAEPYQHFLEICQRILLTREEIINNSSYRISGIAWRYLIENEGGYYETAKWYEEVVRLRKTKPLYKLGYRALAEAVLDMNENPDASNYEYWIKWFKTKHCSEEQMLFQVCVSNIHFKNCNDD